MDCTTIHGVAQSRKQLSDFHFHFRASLVAQMVKNLPANAGDPGLITESGRSPREGNGNPLQYSCLRIPWTEEPGGLQFTGSQSWTRLSDSHTHTHTHTHTQTTGGLLRSADYQVNGGHHGEEKMWLLSPCTRKTLEDKSEMCERYAVPFAMQFDSSFFSCLPTTFNNGFGIPFLYRAVQTYYIFKNVSLSMLSSGIPYEIWVAHFVNPFIQEKTKGFYAMFMCRYIYMYVYCHGI